MSPHPPARPPGPDPGPPLSADEMLAIGYVDGSLAEHQRREAHERLSRDPAFASLVAEYRELDDRLIAHLAPAASAGAAPIAPAPASRYASRARQRWVGVAAVLATAASLAFLAWYYLIPPSAQNFVIPLLPVGTPLVTAQHEVEVGAGFKPEEVCTTAAQFAAWTRTRFGIPVAYEAIPSDVVLIGWSKRDTLSFYTGVLLATVGDQKVTVFFDTVPREADTAPGQPGPTGLRVFTRSLDGLLLYEVTPLAEPRIIPLLKRVSQPTGGA